MANPASQLVYGQLGGHSRVHVLQDGIHVSDDAQTDRVHVGQLPTGDYGLKITNPAGVVIVDGTSAMFHIAATGTLNHSTPANSNLETTVNLGGSYAEVPGFIGYVSETNPTSADRHLGSGIFTPWPTPSWIADVLNGANNKEIAGVGLGAARVTARLSGGQAIISLRSWTAADFAVSHYCRYYLLKEAAF